MARIDAPGKPLPPTGDVRARARAAFREAMERPYRERCESNPYSFELSETGSAYRSPHVQEAFGHFYAGFIAALSAQSPPPADDEVELVARAMYAVTGSQWAEALSATRESYFKIARAAIAAMPRLSPPLNMGEGLAHRLRGAFITCVSAKPDYHVKLKYGTLEQAQEAHSAILDFLDGQALATPSLPGGMDPAVREVVEFAGDIRWRELADGSPFTLIDRQLLSDLHAKARSAGVLATLATSPSSDLIGGEGK